MTMPPLLQSLRHRERPRDEWDVVTGRSTRCLLELMHMHAYFGLLTEEQDRRYLIWACADLLMAALLIEHDVYAAHLLKPTRLLFLAPSKTYLMEKPLAKS
jgi:hypothetical protein